ncbi:hypothetical protein [Flexilinea flocculi]|uniref:Uncharacterized protein n=1 Tax=Flexilinea flocculi TaxID=1678840 RepID=A0A0S7BV64_9CHLR|nr:hypothetical protein [Flexilinea flocculi]GAP40472.1 hypothetical protein ATC1_13448 [Flexilinea flocculi]
MKNHSLKIIVSITACLVFFLFLGSETGMAKERIDMVIPYNGVNIDLGIINCEKDDLDFSPEGWKDIKCYFWIRPDKDLTVDKEDIFRSVFGEIDYELFVSYLEPHDPASKTWMFVTTDAGVNYTVRIEKNDLDYSDTINKYGGIPIPAIYPNDYYSQTLSFYFTIPEAMNYQSLVFPGINLQISISENMEPNIPEIKREILDGVPDSIIIDDIQIELSNDWVVIPEGENYYKFNSLIKVKNLDMTQQKKFNIGKLYSFYHLRANSQFEMKDPDYNLAPLQEEERVLDFTIELVRKSDEIFLIDKSDSNKFYKIKFRVD